MNGVLLEVANERQRQDEKWGGPSHDDFHSLHVWPRWIKNYASWADQMLDMRSYGKMRNRLIQIAAMAVAAVESLDRQVPEAKPPTDCESVGRKG